MRMRARVLGPVVVALGALGALGTAATPAAAQSGPESIPRYDVRIEVRADGDLAIVETIVYDFGGFDRHGIFRDVPTRLRYDDTYDRLFPLRVDSVRGSPGTPVGYVIEDAGGGLTRIKIGDPDRTISGQHIYRIAYTVQGAMNAFEDHDELYWNAIGDQWAVTIGRAVVTVRTPGAITGTACFAGATGSNLACTSSRTGDGVARFAQDTLFPFQGLTVVVGIEKGAVEVAPPILEERWSPARAFRLTPASGGLAAVVLLLGLGWFGWLAWSKGRDRRYRGSQIDQVMGNPHGPTEAVPIGDVDAEAPVEFAPPEGIRPGQVGTLIDERANTLDVTATIVDLAVRGHLVIQEIPKEGWFGKPDWRLVRLGEPEDDLLTYERALLDGLFRDGQEVTMGELRTTFVDRLRDVEQKLYTDTVAQGWFTARPDKVRTRWRLIGFGLTVLGGAAFFLLVAGTSYGLVGLAALIVGIVFLVGAGRMPSRTAKGTAVLRRIRGFRQVVDKADRYMAQWAEQENVFPKVLPYAIVFGLTDKWAKAFEGLATDPATMAGMAWYASSRPFSTQAFAEAVDGFTVATSGAISSTPAGSGSSGLSGGGFSGGGGGGGGGGSW
jgi:uncharacterized protein (TIGR04222 family)